jgi:hypothetical protein
MSDYQRGWNACASCVAYDINQSEDWKRGWNDCDDSICYRDYS